MNNDETKTPEPGLRKLVYTLIIYPDDPHGPIAIVCDTPEQREQKTIEVIFGEPTLDAGKWDQWEKSRETLVDSGTLTFEGDAPIQWLTEWATNSLQPQLDKARADLDQVRVEAVQLATSIWRAEFRDSAPDWRLCDSVDGIISQIDNMYAGVREQRDIARFRLAAAEVRIVNSGKLIASLTACCDERFKANQQLTADLSREKAENARLREFVARIDKIGSSHDSIMLCEEAGRILETLAPNSAETLDAEGGE